MNEKVKQAMNAMKDKCTLEKAREMTKNFSRKQKIIAGGAVGVIAIAAILSFSPLSDLGTATHLGKTAAIQQNTLNKEKAANDIQWLVRIGDKTVLAVNTEEDAKAVFEGLKTYYLNGSTDPNATVVFDKEIGWDPYDAEAVGGDPAWVMSVPDAIAYIIKGTTTPKTYVVQGGDTVWDIAVKSSISVEDLEKMNPGITSSSLQIGSTVNLYDAKPFVAITTTETLVGAESIPYETVYEDSNTLYRGQSKVKTAGVSGSKNVTSQVIKQNGVIVASNVLSEQVTTEPQNQVSLKGTAAVPALTASSGKASSGILWSPMSHMEVSSTYGASRGSRRHEGIDLRNPAGTPFGAAADGVVIYAGYSGSYGNIVKVDHGGGLQTYYAHCNSMSVTAGQKVTKGQTLGTVGSTGNATGNVLHFEVRINGVSQNPLNYL
ncbi:peptidoglycan DD-metalloendopeptidase family protein [Aminipila butyrica]|uniref:Peptidoglycan DD-metalloendopeptidase family protein n=1 Tax=Aminipila butyrica TaxID=433296 RepID=A0A858BYP9_9FIRM|nr:M23 family metallopeptidase [Aminipila butyrica]QIB70255.1 peptidoglycan DD-metalloendopeptidase family protein [Aminipila butyrica]